MNLRARYRPIAIASNILVASAFFVLVVTLLASRNLSLVNLALGCAIILIANLLFLASGMMLPALVAPGPLRFPSMFTLPLAFCAWALVVATLSWRLGNPLEPTLPALKRLSNNYSGLPLIWFPLAQVVAMAIASIVQSRLGESERVESP